MPGWCSIMAIRETAQRHGAATNACPPRRIWRAAERAGSGRGFSPGHWRRGVHDRRAQREHHAGPAGNEGRHLLQAGSHGSRGARGLGLADLAAAHSADRLRRGREERIVRTSLEGVAWRGWLDLADSSATTVLADGAKWIWDEQRKHLTHAAGVLDTGPDRTSMGPLFFRAEDAG